MADVLDYTEDSGPIVRGGRWPPAGGCIEVTLTRTSEGAACDWPDDADEWDWDLLLSRVMAGGTPDLVLDAHDVTITGHVAVVTFRATPAQTNSIGGSGQDTLRAQVRSEDGDGVVSYYARGVAAIEPSVGQS